MDREEAIAELERRRKNRISKEEAIAELARRKSLQAIQQPAAQSKRQGFGAIAGDALSGALEAIPAAGHMLWNLPGQAYESTKQLFTDPKRAGQNILGGLASGGAGLLNAPGNTRDYLVERGILGEDFPSARLPENIMPQNYDYRQGVGLQDNQKGDELLYGLSQFAPNAFTGVAAPALWGIGQNENPVTAQLVPPTFKVGGKVIKHGGKILKDFDLTPSGLIAKYTKDNISLKELADNLRAAEGTETPLGDVLKSPKLKKKYENDLASKAGWDVEQTYLRINEQMQQKAESLLNERLGENAPPGDTNPFVKDLLTEAYKDHTEVKNNLYNEVTNTSHGENFNLELPRFYKSIAGDVTSLLESPMFLSDVKLVAAFNELLGVSGATPTIKGAKFFANKLESEANALKNPDPTSRSIKSLYNRVANAIREDVNNQIAQKGSKKLQEQYKIAEDYYKDEFVQFLDKDLYKILDESKDAQAIVREIIQPGESKDAYTLISKVQKILPENQKNLLGYSYLRQAIDKEGVLQPTKMNQLIKKLGNRQFEALFPDSSTRQALLDFSKLRNMNVEAANYLANPKTGARNQQMISDFMKYLPEAVGGGLGGTSGGTMGALLGVVATRVARTATDKYLAKILTDPNFRNKVGKKITKYKGKESNKKKIKLNKPTKDLIVGSSLAANKDEDKK